MFNFKKDFDFSKVLLIILIIVILSAAVVAIKIAIVRMNDWTLPSKPIQLIKPLPSPPPPDSPSPPPSSIPASTPLPTNNPNNPDTPDPPGSENSEEYLNAVKFLANLIKNLLTHPAFYEAMSVALLLPVVTKTVVYLARVGLVETLRFAAIKALSFLESVVLGLAKKFGIEALKKFGIYLTETVIKSLAERSSLYVARVAADKIAIDAGEKAAEALVKTAVGIAAEEAAASFAGPIGVAFDILQAGGMLIDMLDLGNYKNMQENEALNKIKKQSYVSLMEGLSGLQTPLQLRPTKGPLYDLYKQASISDPESKNANSPKNIITKCYMNAIYNIMNSPSFIDAYTLALETNNKAYLSDIEAQKFMNLHVNPEIVLRYCNEIQCQQYDGISIRLSGDCSFKDYDTCFKSNINYPKNPPEGEVYVEWDSIRKECSMATTTVKDICISKEVGKDNNTGDPGIDYDPKTGLCNITPYYCKNRYGQNINYTNGYPDCYITGFQSFWENIFGKTIVRGLTRTYDNIASSI